MVLLFSRFNTQQLKTLVLLLRSKWIMRISLTAAVKALMDRFPILVFGGHKMSALVSRFTMKRYLQNIFLLKSKGA